MVENFFQFWSSSGIELEETTEEIFCFIAEVLFKLRLASLQADDLRVSLERDLADEQAVKQSTQAPDSCFLGFVASDRVQLRSEEFGSASQLSHRRVGALCSAAKVDDVRFEGLKVDEDVFIFDVTVDDAGFVECDD